MLEMINLIKNGGGVGSDDGRVVQMSGTDVASNVIVALSNLLYCQIHVDLSVTTSSGYLQIHYCKLNVVFVR